MKLKSLERPRKRPTRKLHKSDIVSSDLRDLFSDRTYIMGVLNVTPDSFSDGGLFLDKKRALHRAIEMVECGADIIDVGGESTRPFSREISVEEEIDRVIPVVKALANKGDIPISIDTRKSLVAEEAIKVGACIVNDVSGLRFDPYMAPTVSKCEAALLLMHSRLTPEDMQDSPEYKNLIAEISKELKLAIKMAQDGGVKKNKLIIDPGIGFGKTPEHNLEILARLDELKDLGYPICVGTSRKSFIQKMLNLKEGESRLAGTIASCVAAIVKGANILRVHDVKEVAQAAKLIDLIIKTKVV